MQRKKRDTEQHKSQESRKKMLRSIEALPIAIIAERGNLLRTVRSSHHGTDQDGSVASEDSILPAGDVIGIICTKTNYITLEYLSHHHVVIEVAGVSALGDLVIVTSLTLPAA
jgi:hypothetical protein